MLDNFYVHYTLPTPKIYVLHSPHPKNLCTTLSPPQKFMVSLASQLFADMLRRVGNSPDPDKLASEKTGDQVAQCFLNRIQAFS